MQRGDTNDTIMPNQFDKQPSLRCYEVLWRYPYGDRCKCTTTQYCRINVDSTARDRWCLDCPHCWFWSDVCLSQLISGAILMLTMLKLLLNCVKRCHLIPTICCRVIHQSCLAMHRFLALAIGFQVYRCNTVKCCWQTSRLKCFNKSAIMLYISQQSRL